VSRPVILALSGLVVIVIAIGISIWTRHIDEHPSAPPANVANTAAPAPADTAPATAPSFDVVRIDPSGHTVIAGRSKPKAQVTILDGGKEIGKVTADDQGEWVFVPDQPLPPGNRELSLRAVNPDGSTEDGQVPVILAVPEQKGTALAVKVNPNGTVQILQGPEAMEGAGPVSIDVANYDDKGRLSVEGKAPARSALEIYLDNKSVGRVNADDKGMWQITLSSKLSNESHKLRADQIGPDGKVAARAEISFSIDGVPPSGSITVVVGNSLWRIARRVYGAGMDYVAIYQANKEQIRDPNLIYPGQVFALPKSQ
jgi:hypothetical protein